jgi:hypothetical protein
VPIIDLKENPRLSDPIFYVGAEDDGQNLTGLVPAKFLMRNGSYVMDPAPGGSQNAYMYSDSSGNNKTKGPNGNPHNYLIVPANYDGQKARDFGGDIADSIMADQDGTALPSAIVQMISAFRQGGSQDQQRNPQWGIPKGSVALAFIGGASNHLGYIAASAGFPREWAEIAGGWENGIHGRKNKSIDTSGPHSLSKQNYVNIVQGFNDGAGAGNPPSPFDDHGYNSQPKFGGQTGSNGSGVSGWASSILGINPDEPAPPAWSPQANQPIRYLSSRRVR